MPVTEAVSLSLCLLVLIARAPLRPSSTGRVKKAQRNWSRRGTRRGHLCPRVLWALPGQLWAHKGSFRRRAFREQQTSRGPRKRVEQPKSAWHQLRGANPGEWGCRAHSVSPQNPFSFGDPGREDPAAMLGLTDLPGGGWGSPPRSYNGNPGSRYPLLAGLPFKNISFWKKFP